MREVPVGVEDFKELLDRNYYYVDKSMFIKDIMSEKVVLYTRPRRFGKSLNMSMLNYFYNIKEKGNAYLFQGLEISNNKEAMQHQNKYPVIFMTLKEMKFFTFEEQKKFFHSLIIDILVKFEEVLSSSKLSEIEKRRLNAYLNEGVDLVQLSRALYLISTCLEKHYGEKVVILIDEYDVPLQFAYLKGYYEEMVNFLRNVFSAALKTNISLYQGILTGCLRIAKESIFTGMNNFSVYGIIEEVSEKRFGFTPEEVYHMLSYYEILDAKDEVKTWYDGYKFGNQEVYNPWSVVKYVKQACNGSKQALSFWANTSGNDIIMQYIQQGNRHMKEEFEILINKGSIITKITPELTYREMDDMNNIYSFLLFTGYLKVKRVIDQSEDIYELEIPNKEVKKVYTDQFEIHFKHFTDSKQNTLLLAMEAENVEQIQNILQDILRQSISYHDNKESFYHGFMVGILQGLENNKVVSNRESGDGRFDIVLYPENIDDKVIIIECKHSKQLRELRNDSKEGAKQIVAKNYKEQIINEGYECYVGYGISFYKKQCYVTKSEES